ncbi:MAG: double zinc ribbon domain-containing protein, partial [Promethearchaeota archaeon]
MNKLNNNEKIKCPNCGNENEQLTKFCEECKIELDTDIRFCPECSSVNYVNAMECRVCGTKLTKINYKINSIEKSMTLEEFNALPNRMFITKC